MSKVLLFFSPNAKNTLITCTVIHNSSFSIIDTHYYVHQLRMKHLFEKCVCVCVGGGVGVCVCVCVCVHFKVVLSICSPNQDTKTRQLML